MLRRLMTDALIEGGFTDNIQRCLAAVREHLGMEVAYVSEFVDDRTVFREIDAPGLEARIKVGDSLSLDDVYCRHILAGRLPSLMPDTADYPLAQSLPLTKAAPIGAHVSVPIQLSNGDVYGMFCCLSRNPDPSLNQRDLQIMRVFADLTAHQFERALQGRRQIQDAEDRINHVIASRAFTFHYQPILDFAPLRVVGFEALCRFAAEPYRTPDLWFREAAEAGLGQQLEIAAMGVALEAFQSLPRHVFIAINASPDTILAGGLPDLLSPWPLHRVVLEVTEHAPVADYAALSDALAPLRRAGVRLAIDDAGAGYSSLQHIVQLAPDVIKLDIGLTRAVDKDPGRRALVSALTYFARETGCLLVAEGIETEAEFATLKEMGVSRGQGYLLGRPTALPAAIAAAEAPVAAA